MNAEQGRSETELPQLRAFRSDLIVRFGPIALIRCLKYD